MLLPTPAPDDAAGWVRTHLRDLCCDDPVPSPSRRGATRLSPYIRHGLIDLPTAWAAAADAPARDRTRFRDELAWQEYARHLYARLGRRTASAASPGGRWRSGHRSCAGAARWPARARSRTGPPTPHRRRRNRNRLSGRPVAATFAPVPGFRRLAGTGAPAVLQPWPWLHRPHAGPVSSYSAWRKRS